MLNKRPFDDTVDADEKNPMEPVYRSETQRHFGYVDDLRASIKEKIE